MNIELVSRQQIRTNKEVRVYHRRIWQNIKDLLKSCIGYQAKKRLFNCDGSLIDIDRLQENICEQKQSVKTRQTTWPYLLNMYSPSMTSNDKKIYQDQAKFRYERLKRTWQERVSRGDPFYIKLADTILKDVHRTDRHIKLIKKKKQMLFNIMMTYNVYHPNPGYSQGMTDMLTPIIYVFHDESFSYFAYCSLMTRYMNSLFDHDQIEINHRLDLFHFLFQSIDYELWKTIQLISTDTYLLVYRWLLLDCKREFHSFHHILHVLELVWIYSIPSTFSSLQSKTNHRSLFTVFLCISILQQDRQKILLCSDEEDLHRYFFSSSSRARRTRRSFQQILERAKLYQSNYLSLNK